MLVLSSIKTVCFFIYDIYNCHVKYRIFHLPPPLLYSDSWYYLLYWKYCNLGNLLATVYNDNSSRVTRDLESSSEKEIGLTRSWVLYALIQLWLQEGTSVGRYALDRRRCLGYCLGHELNSRFYLSDCLWG